MRRLAVLVIFLAPLLINPPVSYSSGFVATMNTHTELADVVALGKCISATDRMGEKRRVVDYVLKVSKVYKNVLGISLEPGSNFSFTTFAPAEMIKDSDYLIFVRRLPYGIWEGVVGVQSFFKAEKGADGETRVVNKLNNKGIMRGMEKRLEAPSLGLKSMTKEESKITRQLTGPVELEQLVPVIERINKIQTLKREKKVKIKRKPNVENEERIKGELIRRESLKDEN